MATQFPPIQVEGEGQLFARLHTTQGNLLVALEEEKAPNTVANFVGLAMGTIDWKDPQSGKGQVGNPMYDGVRFHRVIPKFMIQVGDPNSKYEEMKTLWGTGGPGYTFADEFNAGLKHDRPGTLSMANAGANTNGSQIFITEIPTPHLDGRHAVFGYVVDGVDVITKIANVPTRRDCPIEDQFLTKIEIFRSSSTPKA